MKSFIRRHWIIAALITIVSTVVLVPGCLDTQQTRDIKQTIAQVQQTAQQANTAKAQIDQAIAAMPDGPDKDKAVARSQEFQKILDVATTTLTRLNDELAGAQNDSLGLIEGSVKTGVGFIPPPWNAVAYLGAGLVFGLWRAAINRTAARSMAGAIELEQSPEGVVNFDTDATRDNLRARMGAVANRIVDEAQGKSLALPF